MPTQIGASNRPILFAAVSVNHTPPYLPQLTDEHGSIPVGCEFAVGIVYSVIFPAVVMRPILFVFVSVKY